MLFSKKSKVDKAARIQKLDTETEILRAQFERVRDLADSAGVAADKSREAAIRMSSNSAAEETESKSGSFQARRRTQVANNTSSGSVNMPDNVIVMDPESRIPTEVDLPFPLTLKKSGVGG